MDRDRKRDYERRKGGDFRQTKGMGSMGMGIGYEYQMIKNMKRERSNIQKSRIYEKFTKITNEDF